jgi:hypothetical protein
MVADKEGVLCIELRRCHYTFYFICKFQFALKSSLHKTVKEIVRLGEGFLVLSFKCLDSFYSGSELLLERQRWK